MFIVDLINVVYEKYVRFEYLLDVDNVIILFSNGF